MKALRIILLAAALLGLCWFTFLNSATAAELGRSGLDLFDRRPAQHILFIGNSRMKRNNLAAMFREVADSADAPVKYQTRMWAPNARTFADHSAEPHVLALLDRRWDQVILQGESGAHRSDSGRADFASHGAWLVERAKRSGSKASLAAGWTYGPGAFDPSYPGERQAYHAVIQKDYRALAQRSGAALINVGSAWTRVESATGLNLTPDGNHPSTAGTYVYALMVFAHVGGNVEKVTYVPEGLDAEQAAAIRSVVADYVLNGVDTAA